MRTRIRYRRAQVTVKDWDKKVAEKILTGQCRACGRIGKTALHHMVYRYETKEVRKNPRLATHYTIELCFQCHKIADMFRKMAENVDRAHKVNKALTDKLVEDAKNIRQPA